MTALSIESPSPSTGPGLGQKFKSAFRRLSEWTDSETFTGTAICVGLILYVIGILLGDCAHGSVPDFFCIVGVWVCVLVLVGYICSRFPKINRVFDLSGPRWAQLIGFPLLAVLLWSTTWMEYNPRTKYRIRANGVVLSPERPEVSAFPWQNEWAEIRDTYAATDVTVTSSDGQRFRATVTADLRLGDDPSKWPWHTESQAAGTERVTPQIRQVFTDALQAAVGTPGRVVSRQDFSLEIDTGLALRLAEVGLAFPGTVSVSNMRPYFEGGAPEKK